jgi:hypothetical protein
MAAIVPVALKGHGDGVVDEFGHKLVFVLGEAIWEDGYYYRSFGFWFLS